MERIRWMATALLAMVVMGGGCHAATGAPAPAAAMTRDQAKAALRAQLDALFDAAVLSDAHWGVRVETRRGEILYDRNGARGFMPASNLKIFTTAAALETLGPDYTWTTTVEATGPIDADGTLQGSLVIVGGGDPSLGAWHPRDGAESAQLLAAWVAQLKAAGVRRIAGDIVGDGRYFNTDFYNPNWDYFDLPYWYAAGSSGLSFEENAFRVRIMPGAAVGDPTRIEINPNTSYITVINESVTAAAGAPSTADSTNHQTEGNVVRFVGQIPIDREVINERGSIWDAPRYAAHLVMEALEREGIAVDGEARNILAMEPAARAALDAPRTVLIRHTSPPLTNAVNVINEYSHNFFADMVLRTMGRAAGGDGGWDSGVKAVKDWMTRIGAPQVEAFHMKDGSGLASSNIVQPRHFTHVLRHMRNDTPAGRAFYDSLTVAGVGRHLANRLRDPATAGNVRAKTGFIGFARALSGYVTMAGGEELVFSIICNHHSASVAEVDKVTDAALVLIASTTLPPAENTP